VPVSHLVVHTSPDTRVLTHQRGRALLNEPTLNKGTAFSFEERTLLGLHGLLPYRIETLDEQCVATRDRYDHLVGDLERHIFLRSLEDTNEVLFYAFLERNLEELLPVIYTPTVGEACQKFSHIYRRPHGLFLAYPNREDMVAHIAGVEGPVDVIVVTDGEPILGLGDQGVGGMGIPIGKLALYTAAGGIDPRRTLPVLLDVGTNNQELLDDPLYLGWRHTRIDGADYDEFVAEFVRAVSQRFPGAVVQWEDFGGHHAQVILDKYRDVVPSFNDDIQGTAAVALATVCSAAESVGSTLADQRICIAGAGAASCGIASMLAEAMRRASVPDPGAQIVLTDVDGLVHTGRDDVTEAQRPFAVDGDEVALFPGTDLTSVVQGARATVLIGVSGQGGLFDQSVITAMMGNASSPIVLPLSNPTSAAEAMPADVLAWSNGRAVVATGSPFHDVVRDKAVHQISQANNVYVFPGVGLGGGVASRASRVTDNMFFAAAEALAALCPDSAVDGVVPPMSDIGEVSHAIAVAVGRAAVADGVARRVLAADIEAAVERSRFVASYPTVRPTLHAPTRLS
jgi:malate dehydrogenase (oxaloacetate-decarboxylating)